MANQESKKKKVKEGYGVATYCVTPSALNNLENIFLRLRKEAIKNGDKPPSKSSIVSYAINKVKDVTPEEFEKKD